MSDTPITDAAYLRAGRRVDDQIAELDKTCRRLEEERDQARQVATQYAESHDGGTFDLPWEQPDQAKP